MDIMTERVREDSLTTYFGSTWSCASNRIAYTSTERTCHSKKRHKPMETKRIFLIIFNTPVLPVDTTKID